MKQILADAEAPTMILARAPALDGYDGRHRAPYTVSNFLRDPTPYQPRRYRTEDGAR